ncbi:MAG: glycoside hydrolase N-terminal domain-containing protein [Clostridium sp.]|nr:glycoside hydrolase N-terminal domain-containing protein [Clostridium sp.]
MSKHIKLLSLIVAAGGLTSQAFAQRTNEEVWFAQPAHEWMGSLPLGNGRLGAMVYGGTDTETIALNEVTFWSGQPDPEANELCGAYHLAEIRKAFFKGDIAKGNDLGTKYLSGKGKSFGTHLPFGDVKIKLSGNGKIKNYSRTLDLRNATATIRYEQGGVAYKREYFCSHPTDIIVVCLTANKKNAISAELNYNLLREANVSVLNNSLRAEGKVSFPKLGPGGVAFASNVKVANRGGKLNTLDKSIQITDADTLLLYIDLQTDYTNKYYTERLDKHMASADQKTYQNLYEEHVNDYQTLYNRLSVKIGKKATAGADKPTDIRWQQIKRGRKDPQFDALFYQFGRYMLIASSREDSPLASNLQGIWNDNLACNMGWTCDYHFDINIQQNYWSANVANLPMCNLSLFNHLEKLIPAGHETAKKVYGCDGWCAHTVVNAWGYTAPGGGVGWGLHPTGGAWMATQVWTHYLYTRDNDFLRQQGYPILKETARFFMDYMVTDPNNGYLVTGPSISPENSFVLPDGGNWCLSMMPTVDLAIVKRIYEACIEAADILGVDADMANRLRNDIKKLPPFRMDGEGLFAEWMVEGARRNDPAHRHSSHLLPLYPFGQISYTRQPELMDAARRSIESQLNAKGWEDTEWSRANMLCFYARLKDKAEAYKSLRGLYSTFMRENLMTVSPAGIAGAESDIFSFDANEAAVAGISEMLLQSYDGFVEFLPALPAEWADGEINGICAEDGLVCNMTWNDSRLREATLEATVSKPVTIRLNASWGKPGFTLDGRTVNAQKSTNDLYTLDVKAGQQLRINF